MNERGLTLESEWIRDATFDTPSGREATHRILDSRAGLPDAIVFANDLMALGGLEVLRDRGVDVPSQIRVTGFDDVDLSVLVTPTLSTVAQAIEAKAWMAGKAMLDAVNGLAEGPLPPLTVDFLPRGSCGCGDAEQPHRSARHADQLLFDSRHTMLCLSQITEFLGSVLSLSELSAQLTQLIPLLGIGAVYVSLYDDGPPPTKYCHLVAAVEPDGTPRVDPEHPRRYLGEQIVPAMLHGPDQSELFVQELYKADQRFGFLVTRFTGADPAVFVALRDQISEALLNIQHVYELDESQKALTLALGRATESERQYRELAQSLPLFIMETSADGTIPYLNDAARALFEVSEEERNSGLTLAEFLDPDVYPRGRTPEPSEGYQNLRFVSRSGRKIALLARSVELEAGTGRRRWSGLDYKPVLESLTAPDGRVIEEHGLTRRESEVLGLELRGLLAKEIASELSISLSTVKGHLGLLYRKLGVGSRDQLFSLFGKNIIAAYGFESLVFSLLSEVLKG
jgi:DNA-binding CsgD family transcriptional regulator